MQYQFFRPMEAQDLIKVDSLPHSSSCDAPSHPSVSLAFFALPSGRQCLARIERHFDLRHSVPLPITALGHPVRVLPFPSNQTA